MRDDDGWGGIPSHNVAAHGEPGDARHRYSKSTIFNSPMLGWLGSA